MDVLKPKNGIREEETTWKKKIRNGTFNTYMKNDVVLFRL